MIPNANNFKLGGTQVQKIYDGSTLVWPTNTQPDIPLSYISNGSSASGLYDVFYYPDYYVSRKTRIRAYFSHNLPANSEFPLFGVYWQQDGDERTDVNKYSYYLKRTSSYTDSYFYWGSIYNNSSIDTTVGPTSSLAAGVTWQIYTYLNGRNGPVVGLSVYDDGWDRYTQTAGSTGFGSYNKLLIFKDGNINVSTSYPGGIKLYSLTVSELLNDPFTPQGAGETQETIVHNYIPVLHYTTTPWASISGNIIHPANQYYPCLYDTITGQYCYNGGTDDPVYQIQQ